MKEEELTEKMVDLVCEMFRKLVQENKELKQENEHLKKEIKRLKDEKGYEPLEPYSPITTNPITKPYVGDVPNTYPWNYPITIPNTGQKPWEVWYSTFNNVVNESSNQLNNFDSLEDCILALNENI